MGNQLITFLLPAYNETENILPIFDAICNQMQGSDYSFELLFIDDGSQDETLSAIRSLAINYKFVKYVSFSRNFGKEAAIYAGLQHAKGDAVILMDVDLQHPPSLIHELIEGYKEGNHQVVAKRNREGDSKLRTFLSTTFYRFMNQSVNVKLIDGEGDFRLLSRKAVEALLRLSEGNRFSKGLYEWIGMRKKTISYENVARENGKSKWSIGQLLNYGIDGLVSFNTKPLRLCFYAGAIIMSLSLLYILYSFISILQFGIDVPGYFTLISAILFLGGLQLFCLGILGEYIGRIYNETKKRPHYLIDDTNIMRSEGERERRIYHES
ncbi:glycosyltransferase family 2 protein [Sporosarcina sp. Marseille-Q4063]|uniref:glycosyltransferase family 2 protein n=1 Tax=Sporosarcina sp. Marseille-Q4063 TaxID=2810514 RepID=UPI001BAED6E2|nr:glycosyltransferase family 2 protein [Sporosarcina sp. Marseille-Q4063]QUW23805.1 glycosyltransferase family 2 protein [Sporosarcina sp. Marseille-Q4063]